PNDVVHLELELDRFVLGHIDAPEVARADELKRRFGSSQEQYAQEQQRIEHTRLTGAIGPGQQAHAGRRPIEALQDAKIASSDAEGWHASVLYLTCPQMGPRDQ